MKTVLVLLDSFNRRCLKIYNPKASGITPNIDAFAADSTVFDNHFIGSAPCMPARRDIFTGRMHFLERGWGGIEPFDITLPKILRNNNVFTHITTDHAHYFEVGGENYCAAFNTWDFQRGQETDAWVSRVCQPKPNSFTYGRKFPQQMLNQATFKTEEEYPTPRTFRSACNWLQANKESDDFFLMVDGFDPHEPFETPKKYLAMYETYYKGQEFNWSSYSKVAEPDEALQHLNNTYLATLTMADYWFGEFIKTLKETNMYDETLIIFTTDHGHLLGEHDFTGKNITHAYNELSHIPLVVHWPSSANAGIRFAGLTQNIDLMPTILNHHACDIPTRVKGCCLLHHLMAKAKPRQQVIYGWFGRAVNIYDGQYTYFRAPQNKDNKPCYQYCAMPSTAYRYFDEDYAECIEMGRFLSYTNYPVYKMPLLKGLDDSDNLSYVMQTVLFDIKSDYAQQHPLCNKELETSICKKLVKNLQEMDCPADQYLRLGLLEFI